MQRSREQLAEELLRPFICGMNVYYVPPYMHSGLLDYIFGHVPPGGFLRAVLENNLTEACARADEHNMANLPAYANFLYNFAPMACRGSREAVDAWIDEGIKAREREAGAT